MGGVKVVQQSRVVVIFERGSPTLDRWRYTMYALSDPPHHYKCHCSMQVGLYSAPQANRQATKASTVMISVESVCTRLQAEGGSVNVSLNALQNFVFTTGIHRRAHSPPKRNPGFKTLDCHGWCWAVSSLLGSCRSFSWPFSYSAMPYRPLKEDFAQNWNFAHCLLMETVVMCSNPFWSFTDGKKL